MTQGVLAATILWMGKGGKKGNGDGRRGDRDTVPSEYKERLAKKIKQARLSIGLTHAEMAKAISGKIGQEVKPDTYRKWETTQSTMWLHAITAFCDITQTHPFELLGTGLTRIRQPDEAA